MEITITGKHFHPSEQMKAHAEQKARKMGRFFDGIESISLTLWTEGGRQRAEMVVQAKPRARLVAEESHADMLVAIDLTADKMERQLKRFKGKLRDHREGRRP